MTSAVRRSPAPSLMPSSRRSTSRLQRFLLTLPLLLVLVTVTSVPDVYAQGTVQQEEDEDDDVIGYQPQRVGQGSPPAAGTGGSGSGRGSGDGYGGHQPEWIQNKEVANQYAGGIPSPPSEGTRSSEYVPSKVSYTVMRHRLEVAPEARGRSEYAIHVNPWASEDIIASPVINGDGSNGGGDSDMAIARSLMAAFEHANEVYAKQPVARVHIKLTPGTIYDLVEGAELSNVIATVSCDFSPPPRIRIRAPWTILAPELPKSLGTILFDNIIFDASVDSLRVQAVASIKFSHCSFVDNMAQIVHVQDSNAQFENCEFLRNRATHSTSRAGACVGLARSNVTFSECHFASNHIANSGGAVFTSDTTALFNDCTFVNNVASNDGGALALAATSEDYTTTMNNCKFVNNTATHGGSVVMKGPTLKMMFATFLDSTASIGGGAVFVESGSIYLQQINMYQCQVRSGNGGAVYIKNSTRAVLTSVNFVRTRGNAGGAAFITAGALDIQKCTFVNVTSGQAGAVYSAKATLSVLESTFHSCSSGLNGGGVFVNEGPVSIGGVLFYNMTAPKGAGGAIYVIKPPLLKIRDSRFMECSAGRHGGAVYIHEVPFTNIALERLSILGARATEGAGIFVHGGGVQIDRLTCHHTRGLKHGGCMFLNTGVHAEVRDSSFTHNWASEVGAGAMVDRGRATFHRCTFAGNSARGGSGVYVNGGIFVVQQSSFSNHSAEMSGAAIFVSKAGHITTQDCNFDSGHSVDGAALFLETGEYDCFGTTFTRNNASQCGGSISIKEGNMRFAECTFVGNQATHGGALFVNDGHVNISSTYFDSNTALENGGALLVQGGLTRVDFSRFKSNLAHVQGGAINVMGGELQVLQADLTNNSADGNGGAIHQQAGELTVVGSSFAHNRAQGNGGAVYITDSSPEFNITIFDHSSAYNGGAVFVSDSTVGLDSHHGASRQRQNPRFSGCSFLHSNATVSGGAVYVFSGQVSMLECSVALSSARHGAAVFIRHGVANLHTCLFESNRARAYGGCIALDRGHQYTHECIYVNNTGANDGSSTIFHPQLFGNLSSCSWSDVSSDCTIQRDLFYGAQDIKVKYAGAGEVFEGDEADEYERQVEEQKERQQRRRA